MDGTASRSLIPDIDFPRSMQFLFHDAADDGSPVRYRVAWGGRGATKSWNFARALLLKSTRDPLRILCGRELQVSIADSVHALLKLQIAQLGLDKFFDVKETSIESAIGGEFIFTGVRNNITKVKSMEGLDIAWIEEAEKTTKNSWAVITPTLRKSGSEIWASFNTDLETDPIYSMFVSGKPPPGSIVRKVSWRDNPWFPIELERERAYLASIDDDAYQHVWEGAPRRAGKQQVLNGKYVCEAFEPGANWHGPYYGADWGFAVSPTAAVKMWINGARLYVEHEAYAIGLDIDATPAYFKQAIPGIERHTLYADCARPETISYMQRNSFPSCIAADKWQGSIEDGIAFLRSFEKIVIHPRCTHALQEARLWSYKVDPLTGDVLPVLIDKHDNIWDAARYALSKIIKQSGQGMYYYMAELARQQDEAIANARKEA